MMNSKILILWTSVLFVANLVLTVLEAHQESEIRYRGDQPAVEFEFFHSYQYIRWTGNYDGDAFKSMCKINYLARRNKLNDSDGEGRCNFLPVKPDYNLKIHFISEMFRNHKMDVPANSLVCICKGKEKDETGKLIEPEEKFVLMELDSKRNPYTKFYQLTPVRPTRNLNVDFYWELKNASWKTEIAAVPYKYWDIRFREPHEKEKGELDLHANLKNLRWKFRYNHTDDFLEICKVNYYAKTDSLDGKFPGKCTVHLLPQNVNRYLVIQFPNTGKEDYEVPRGNRELEIIFCVCEWDQNRLPSASLCQEKFGLIELNDNSRNGIHKYYQLKTGLDVRREIELTLDFYFEIEYLELPGSNESEPDLDLRL